MAVFLYDFNMKTILTEQINYASINFRDWSFSYFYSDQGLVFTTFQKEAVKEFEKWSGLKSAFLQKNTAIDQAFSDYFAGQSSEIDLKIDWHFWQFSDFQLRVLKALQKVTQPISYTDLAERLADKKAVRAVATAVGKNPIELLIPCHRIISKSGQIGQYRDGSDVKRALLELEGK